MTLQDILDWIHLRFVGADAALAGFSKAFTKLEKDIEIRARHAEQSAAKAVQTLAWAKVRADLLNSKADESKAIVAQQIERKDALKTLLKL